ncbi:FAD-dependent 5-carboxymethylaminomethyl-2-thiouridine(34) oxidoreductase MnmC [uncultured Methylibium sp.]|uniref:FAD-dependent 5-carboxymethylaminomethyl-2-thiouridine(34) oxidoreductase MnmC n=1 Tax=uncultured Methylibium sp. TaxID=381093 RepID=UPI0025F94E45|nr:FAD-dependent 5-carboxymethylaminomethyl-2-thiouridine(34) oxidoreductase MnmC [uncultured Methylibium sp.]
MKTAPIEPARIALAPDGLPHAPDFGDVYHPAAGATGQARHVFLGGNGLPARWGGRPRFVVLETGFGLGNNFLATWDAWRHDPQRCERLWFLAIDKHPPTRADLARLQASSTLPELARQLVAAWPALTPNLHALEFESGRVRLLLGFGDVAALLPQVMASVDAFFLDGFAPDRNPAMWSLPALKQVGRLAAPGATAATWSSARALREGLATAGFEVSIVPGFSGKRDMTTARYAPRHRPAVQAGGLQIHTGPREALVVGAGLAGCAAARALGREGWQVTVLDRAASIAQGASGNPAGLFHGVVHGDDGPHARLHRAAALATERLLRPWISGGRVRGQIDGLLRLAGTPATSPWPIDYVESVSGQAARARSGLAAAEGGWWFPGGGWVVPGDYAGALLEAGDAHFAGNACVEAIERRSGRWHALDEHGASIADAPVLVLATAIDLPRLLGPALAEATGTLAAVRGQITGLPAAGLPAPRVPVADAGYVLPAVDGVLWCGSTARPGDADGRLREADHRHNLAQAARLLAAPAIEALPTDTLQGRVGWRAVTPDRLPLVGALPDLAACTTARHDDRLRRLPRLRDADGGLYVIAALGSRGVTWAALCGELLASWVAGTPCPVEADLRDTLDPARAWLAARRRVALADPQT